jgi:IclR family acetate operon transcriptional repressor
MAVGRTDQAKRGVETVKRAFTLLRCFSQENPELGVTELSHRLDVHKSTVSRLLSTLQSESMVVRNPETGRYRLGVGLIELASLAMLDSDMRRIAPPMLRELAEETNETVNLAVLDGHEVINVELIQPLARRVSNYGWVGRRTPLHASSTGKALIADLPETAWAGKLAGPLTKYTEQTITDPDELRAELRRVRKLGYALGLEELEIGLNAVAAPVCNHAGLVVAAVSTAGPSYRLSRELIENSVAKRVIECANRIADALGCPPQRERK